MAVDVWGTAPQSSAPSVWLRMRVRWRRWKLTRELAAGADPDACAELTIVARDLIGAPMRQRLADAIDHVLTVASRPRSPWTTKVALNRREILNARDDLAALAERLCDGAPTPVQGMAIAVLLLEDGRSPIYDWRAAKSVWSQVRAARERLDDPVAA
jgi:hypothetical protein